MNPVALTLPASSALGKAREALSQFSFFAICIDFGGARGDKRWQVLN
jgi:hypothetical protein